MTDRGQVSLLASFFGDIDAFPPTALNFWTHRPGFAVTDVLVVGGVSSLDVMIRFEGKIE